ncbi:TolC family protein, partial [Verrucomicrobia bacterium]|nr:TolC family protein [Verrucomicrobiota bacterium]
VGKASELDVLQAESGLAERKATENEAYQRLRGAKNATLDLMMDSSITSQRRIVAGDKPQIGGSDLPSLSSLQNQALAMNPDYLSLQIDQAQNEIRHKVARNQQLPQLDLTGGYTMSGVGTSPGASHRQTQQSDFPAWSVGLQFRIPLAGARRARKQTEAAQLRVEASRLAIEGAAVEIANVIETSARNVQTSNDSVGYYKKVVDFNEKLLETQLARLGVGKTTSRVVFETERDLFESRINYLRSLVLIERAILQLDTIVGASLAKREMEVDKIELVVRTSKVIRNGKIDQASFQLFVEEMQERYQSIRKKNKISK